MVSYYPEVLQQKEFIEKVIRTEEERFNETINEGLEILNQVIQEVKTKTVRLYQEKTSSNYTTHMASQ